VKRKVAIAFFTVLLLLVAASLALARTEWAGRRLCSAVAERVRAAGLPLVAESCRVDPLRLEVEAGPIQLGPLEAPFLRADRLRLRLAPVQALGGALELAEVELVRPRLTAAIPAPDPSRPKVRCPPQALSSLHVERLSISEGALDLGLPGGGRVRADQVEVRAAPASARRGLQALTSGTRRTDLALAVGRSELTWGGRAVRLDSASVEVVLALDLSTLEVIRGRAEGEGGQLSVRGALQNLCDPSLDLEVAARAPLRALLDAAGRKDVAAAGEASAEVRLSGRPATLAVEGVASLAGGRVGSYQPGDVKVGFRYSGREVELRKVEVATAGGEVVARGKLRLGREPTLEAEARLEGTELGEVLARFGLPGAWVSMRVRGEVRAAGTVWPLALRGTGSLDLADFRVLDHAWDKPRAGERPILEFRRGHLETRLVATPQGIRLEDARIKVGAEELTAQSELRFTEAGGFAVDLAGGADLSELGHVASVPMSGRAVLVGRVQAAPYGNPRVEASVRARDLRFLRLDLGEAGAEIAYGAGGAFLLRAARIEGKRGDTRYSGEIAVDLAASPPALSGGRFEARGRLRDLFEGAMPWLPEARVARDALDAPAQVDASLQGPSDALEAEFTARLGAGGLLGRPFDSGQASGRVEEGRRVVFDRAELRRGSGLASGSGWIGLGAPFPWEIEASAAGVALEGLRLPGGRWDGSASGQARLHGSFEKPEIRFSGSGEGVSALGVPVGAVQVGGTLLQGELLVTGSAEGVRFSGQARTGGDMPFEARAELDVEDLTRFVPGGPPAGLRARARGEARARGLLADPRAAEAEVTFTELQVGYADFRVQNKGPVRIATGGGRAEVRSFTLAGTNTELSVSGAREPDGRLSFLAEGSLDLRLLGGLVPGVARPRGQLLLEAHVSGTAAEPLLVGSGRLRDAGFQIRDQPIVLSALNGDLSFSQNRVIFDHLPGLVNGGRAELGGEVELARLLPSKVRATALLEEVPLRIPAALPSRVSGQLSVAGSWDSMLLSGKLDVVWASYTERVDLEKSLVEFWRRVSAPRSFDKSGEWLRLDVELVLDGDIRIENDVLRGGVRGALTLTGTLSSMGLLGTVTMLPGALVTFRGHDFLLTHAVVDLTERRRIRAQLDVQGEAQVRDYQVFMHYFGPFEDPQLQLSSLPALTQEDVITLLSLGVTSRDAAVTGGVGGAAYAALGQALFSVAGLDEQVKRFLPRVGLVRDFSLRITSAYSEGTGQVVPKAEFESKVGERLRLRYQAPISGTNKDRGQQAQAEWRISDRFGRPSVQLQWDNDNPDVAIEVGLDLRFRLEWSD
jgi:translocation and assembly module TamB